MVLQPRPGINEEGGGGRGEEGEGRVGEGGGGVGRRGKHIAI